MAGLEASAYNGGAADYSHTMQFRWDLPQGYTYTSASGNFSPSVTPVPEPMTLSLVGAALLAAGVASRRRANKA